MSSWRRHGCRRAAAGRAGPRRATRPRARRAARRSASRRRGRRGGCADCGACMGQCTASRRATQRPCPFGHPAVPRACLTLRVRRALRDLDAWAAHARRPTLREPRSATPWQGQAQAAAVSPAGGSARPDGDAASGRQLGGERADGRAAEGPGDQARSDIDGGLRELRKDEPDVDAAREGAQGGQGPRHPGRPRGHPAPGVRARGHDDRLRARAGGAEEAGAAAQAGAGEEPAGQGRRHGRRSRPAAGRVRRRRLRRSVGGRRRRRAGRRCPASSCCSRRSAARRARPTSDPAFTSVTKNVKTFAKAKRAHPPAASKAKEAQDAALAPTDDLDRPGQGRQGRHDGRPAGRARSTRRRSSPR